MGLSGLGRTCDGVYRTRNGFTMVYFMMICGLYNDTICINSELIPSVSDFTGVVVSHGRKVFGILIRFGRNQFFGYPLVLIIFRVWLCARLRRCLWALASAQTKLFRSLDVIAQL